MIRFLLSPRLEFLTPAFIEVRVCPTTSCMLRSPELILWFSMQLLYSDTRCMGT